MPKTSDYPYGIRISDWYKITAIYAYNRRRPLALAGGLLYNCVNIQFENMFASGNDGMFHPLIKFYLQEAP